MKGRRLPAGQYLMKIAFLFVATIFISWSVSAIDITNKPLQNTDAFHVGRKNGGVIDTIVIHFCSDVVAHPDNPFDVDSVIRIFTTTKTSAHYLIDREGKIYRLVRDEDTAYHAGIGFWHGRTLLNPYSIGIELLGIGSGEEMRKIIGMGKADYDKIPSANLGYTEKQYASLNALIADLESRYPKIAHDRKHIIGHDEYAPSRKVDPGIKFDWSKLGLQR